jgi:hypothetical protein
VEDALIGLLGVIAGALLTGAFGWWTDRQRRRREVVVAAARCLDRLEKIRLLAAPDAAAGEIALLGGDMDVYLAAVGAAPGRAFATHYALYERLRPILIKQDVSGLPDVITAFERELAR